MHSTNSTPAGDAGGVPAAPGIGLRIAEWAARLVAAAILGQTLFFKFSAAPESVYIFTQVGMEPVGRIGSGVAELVAALLLLVPLRPAAAVGAVLALGVMGGALVSHLTVLGIEVQGDGGLLFGLACVVTVATGFVLVLHRRSLPLIGARLPR